MYMYYVHVSLKHLSEPHTCTHWSCAYISTAVLCVTPPSPPGTGRDVQCAARSSGAGEAGQCGPDRAGQAGSPPGSLHCTGRQTGVSHCLHTVCFVTCYNYRV